MVVVQVGEQSTCTLPSQKARAEPDSSSTDDYWPKRLDAEVAIVSQSTVLKNPPQERPGGRSQFEIDDGGPVRGSGSLLLRRIIRNKVSANFLNGALVERQLPSNPHPTHNTPAGSLVAFLSGQFEKPSPRGC